MAQLKKRRSWGSWLAAVVGAAVIAAGVFLWHQTTRTGAGQGPAAASSAPATATGLAPAGASSAIHHPIGDAAPAPASTASLPALDASDASVAAALLALGGDESLARLLRRDQIIRRIVATVDALPRESVGTNILPLQPPGGRFLTDQAGDTITLSPRNAERYAPYLRVLEQVDPQALVGWYVQHYSLFQQAYRDLGYPKGYFNDRLITAIDDMLAAPVPDGPVQLVQPKVFYRYADPGLEARSAGQKLMMRLGAADETRAKAKLRTLRERLTGSTLPPDVSAH